MSEENVALVRRLVGAWDRGDWNEALSLVSQDLVSYRAHPDGATFHGIDGFLEMTMDWIEGFTDWEATGEEFIDAGDRVVVRVRQTATGEASGVSLDSLWWFVIAVRDGKAVRVDIFNERTKALEAAGLSE